ncbi:chemotaxis protein CheW [Dehalobacter sp. DCM]|uniref:chemotaxis protein CheW n=1 Tax=Dehalobacter sp. DCM TaxID=2907827 RepID=UPI00308176D3|nr:chemotaxis protein CheW [Dehalobacter sp. DCM]
MRTQSVIFTLGDEEYGIPIDAVQEITQIEQIFPVPKSVNYVRGLIDIRGHAIPLLDLNMRFGLNAQEKSDFAIIMKINDDVVALGVDQIKEVIWLDDIVPPPPLISAAFIEGIVNLPGRIIIQLSPERILEKEELMSLQTLA